MLYYDCKAIILDLGKSLATGVDVISKFQSKCSLVETSHVIATSNQSALFHGSYATLKFVRDTVYSR